MLPGLPPPFLHTASDQKLDGGKASERGYQLDAEHFHPNEHLVETLSKVSQSSTCNRESSFHCRCDLELPIQLDYKAGEGESHTTAPEHNDIHSWAPYKVC